jgi:pimeloyl-ACP methyl ester carboxylesterase
MKNWKTCLGYEKTATALLGVLAVLSLALGTASAAPTPTAQRHADPFEKGATRLMDLPAPERLPSETNSPMLARLAHTWASLSPEMTLCATTRSNHLVHIAVHRIHPASDRPVLVLVHGLLSDHTTWEYVAAELARDYELWLVDLPGCGDSDAPKPSRIEPDGYSPTAMGDRVWQALQQCLSATTPSRPISLVGHSLGGMVVLRMMSAPELRARYASLVQQVERVVLVAPCDFAVNAIPPQFGDLLGLKGWMVGLGQALGAVEPKVRTLTQVNYNVDGTGTIEQQRRFEHALVTGPHREAAQAMLLQAVPFGLKTRRPIWPQIASLVADYANINTPVLIVYGIWDETLSAAMGNKLKDEIPGAVLVKVPERGHSLPTEDPMVCAKLIQRFQQGRTPAELAAGFDMDVFPATSVLRSISLPTPTVAPDPKPTTLSSP